MKEKRLSEEIQEEVRKIMCDVSHGVLGLSEGQRGEMQVRVIVTCFQ